MVGIASAARQLTRLTAFSSSFGELRHFCCFGGRWRVNKLSLARSQVRRGDLPRKEWRLRYNIPERPARLPQRALSLSC